MLKQCTLRRGKQEQTAWIPEFLAHLGQPLNIKGEDGWIVVLVGQIRMTQDEVSKHSQDYKHQRKVSDI